MANVDDESNGELPEITNRMLMDEIAAVYRDLKGDIIQLGKSLSGRIDRVENRLEGVEKNLKNLTYKVDQNQIAFLTNLEDHDRRIKVLETAAA